MYLELEFQVVFKLMYMFIDDTEVSTSVSQDTWKSSSFHSMHFYHTRFVHLTHVMVRRLWNFGLTRHTKRHVFPY